MKLTDVIAEEYKTVEGKEIKIIETPTENSIDLFETLLELWKNKYEKNFPDETGDCIRKCEENFFSYEKYPITVSQITQLSIYIEKYENMWGFLNLGFFFSGIINEHQKQTKYNGTHTLLLNMLETPLRGLGFQNNANVYVNGNASSYLCHEMKHGTFTLNGNAEGMMLCSKISGGKITIVGNTDGQIGTRMKGGEICINGTCTGEIGHVMYGGTIKLHQKEKNISGYMIGGKIYNDDKLIWSPFRNHSLKKMYDLFLKRRILKQRDKDPNNKNRIISIKQCREYDGL